MEIEGYLKKKSLKTDGKKVVDVWQKRYFVLAGGELKYFKSEKHAGMMNSVPLKSINLSQVHSASINPRHTDMFVIDLGAERKVKLQAANSKERDAWVNAIEQSKLKVWSSSQARADSMHPQTPTAELSESASTAPIHSGGTPLASSAPVAAIPGSKSSDTVQSPPREPPGSSLETELIRGERGRMCTCSLM